MIWFLALFACSPENTLERWDPTTWRAGQFDFYTNAVEDGCLEGALEALFMPEGPDTPHEFEYPIYLPSFEELPTSYTVDLRDPFVSMPVTVEEGAEWEFNIRGSVMNDVELGRPAYGDCTVTMTVDADLVPDSDDTVSGSAWIDISNAQGEDGRCPVFEAEDCTVTLSITAQRQGT